MTHLYDSFFKVEQRLIFTITRKRGIIFQNLVLPILMLGWISVLATIIPSDSGEKFTWVWTRNSFGPGEMKFLRFLAGIEVGLIIFMQVIDGNLAPSGGDKPVYLKTVILGRVFRYCYESNWVTQNNFQTFHSKSFHFISQFRYHSSHFKYKQENLTQSWFRMLGAR